MSDTQSIKVIENYEAALHFLYQFVNYERKMTEIYAPEKMDPFRPARILYAAGDPQRNYLTIHIAGTKGKGSVAAMCATALRAAGLRVGLYTSPHLQDLRERIRVITPEDERGHISKADFVRLVNELHRITHGMRELTWFELLTALAFMHFAEQEVDAAIVEVGLGGRLDATNVVMPVVSVITSLSLDHTGLLGNTLAQIAAEKGGIIKYGVPVVCAPQSPEAQDVITEIAEEHRAPLTVVGKDWDYTSETVTVAGECCAQQAIRITRAPDSAAIQPGQRLTLALRGNYQGENAAVALAALDLARPHLPAITAEAMTQGVTQVVWPGRLQFLDVTDDQPSVLVDGAHNADSAQKLARYLQEACRYRKLWLVLGITADKNVHGILRPLLPLASQTIVTKADNPRATDPEILRNEAAELGYDVLMVHGIEAAIVQALTLAKPTDLVCVTGSLYIVGDLLNCWDGLKSQLLR